MHLFVWNGIASVGCNGNKQHTGNLSCQEETGGYCTKETEEAIHTQVQEKQDHKEGKESTSC